MKITINSCEIEVQDGDNIEVNQYDLKDSLTIKRDKGEIVAYVRTRHGKWKWHKQPQVSEIETKQPVTAGGT